VIATFIGTFGQWHGVDVLAQAIRRMVLERRKQLDALQLRFLLIGDGQKMALVRGRARDTDADRYVHLAGLVPQRAAPRFLAASDLLLSPHVGNADGSRFFGSPTKLFEYMAMGAVSWPPTGSDWGSAAPGRRAARQAACRDRRR